jgi:hypothetical protein
LQKAAQIDTKDLCSKLAGVVPWWGERTHCPILATYLLSHIKGDSIALDMEPQLRQHNLVQFLGSGSYGEVNEVTWLK